MRGTPSEETIMPFIAQGFNEANTKILQKIRKAWNKVGKKDKELKGRRNGVIGSYHKWLKSRVQGIAWLKKLKGLNGEETEVLKEVVVLKQITFALMFSQGPIVLLRLFWDFHMTRRLISGLLAASWQNFVLAM